MKLTILGSGTSQGIPVIGCSCPVCTSADSRDRRMRCSLYIESAGELLPDKKGEGSSPVRALIDAGPEFRLQALRAGITGLDAIFLTHSHADHIHGLDDIRPLCKEKPMPLYGNDLAIAEFLERFSYVFRTTQLGGGKPQISPIITQTLVRLGGLSFIPIPAKHGNLNIFGWKITEAAPSISGGTSKTAVSVVYLTDCSHIDEAAINLIAQDGPPELVIIDGLRIRPHETHFSFEQALYAAVQMGAKQIFLTHICHDNRHQKIEEYCRNFAQKQGLTVPMGPAWDGLTLEL